MYRIKDWHKFQHFKDRKPPWIKLYRDLLDDVEWHDLDAKAAKALVMIWLIASEYDGALPNMKTLAFRLRVSENEAKSIVSKLSHWLIQHDINVISERYQDDRLEKERETETETEGEGETERARATRLPQDWQPSKKGWVFGESEGVDVSRELDKFRDYWLSKPKDNTKLDWEATWRNWCRKADKKAVTRHDKLMQWANSEEKSDVLSISQESGRDDYFSLPDPTRHPR
jgi:hypothetical protein